VVTEDVITEALRWMHALELVPTLRVAWPSQVAHFAFQYDCPILLSHCEGELLRNLMTLESLQLSDQVRFSNDFRNHALYWCTRSYGDWDCDTADNRKLFKSCSQETLIELLVHLNKYRRRTLVAPKTVQRNKS